MTASATPGDLGGEPIATDIAAGQWNDTNVSNNQWYFYSIYATGSVPEDYPTNQTPVQTPTPKFCKVLGTQYLTIDRGGLSV
jgi:hypothetical protein